MKHIKYGKPSYVIVAKAGGNLYQYDESFKTPEEANAYFQTHTMTYLGNPPFYLMMQRDMSRYGIVYGTEKKIVGRVYKNMGYEPL